MSLRILAIGDVVGRPGRQALQDHLPTILERHGIGFCVANAENAAGGSGVTPQIAKDLFESGIDCITAGDHVWKKKEIVPLIESDHRILRPHNLSKLAAGSGASVIETRDGHHVGVINLIGRVFMQPAECPFRGAEEAIARLSQETSILIVDLHAEATSEKISMGWHLDGKVSAVFGTHTHVQTADEHVLPQGTAYITDLGMTGPHESILGRRIDRVLKATLTQMPTQFEVAKHDVRISGAIVTADVTSGKAESIERFQERLS